MPVGGGGLIAGIAVYVKFVRPDIKIIGKDIFDDTRSIAEPAGALAIAGLKKYVEREQVTGHILIAIDSGANMNFDRLRYRTGASVRTPGNFTGGQYS